VIDLSAVSDQPYHLDERYVTVYNGEIFNYIELREELKALGYQFTTEGDTEVLMHAYQAWGADCQDKLNGMWAFVIYDKVEKTLFCSRDRFGIKPFNYAIVDGVFVFASEIKAILHYFPQLQKPNYNVIANYCRTSLGAQHHETWFGGVERLAPAHCMTMGASSGVGKAISYWDFPAHTISDLNETQVVEEYRALFIDAVKLRMRSDVPVGTSLSAGLDSTSIVASLRQFFDGPHHTFTATYTNNTYLKSEYQNYREKGFEIDEASVAAKTSTELGLDQELIHLDYQHFVADLRKIVWHLESGNSSPATLPSMQIMEAARKKVTVLMEGQGADETLGGYITNLIVPVILNLIVRGRFSEAYHFGKQSFKLYSWQSAVLMFVRKMVNSFSGIGHLYRSFSGLEGIYGQKLKRYTPIKDYPSDHGYAKQTYVNRILIREHRGGLGNLLHYGDALSMAHSLEARLPFLDHRLVELSFKTPYHMKLKEGMGKFLHRKAMLGIVHEDIRMNRLKFGFVSPIGQYFMRSTAQNADSPVAVLLSEKALSRGLFEKAGLIRLLDEHESGKKNHAPLFFRMLTAELWFQEFMDRTI
jgi:asparagine synthase (glutamine-hydrolysing)